MVHLPVQLLTLLIGTVIPLLTAFVTKEKASSGLKAVVCAVLSAVAGAAVVAVHNNGSFPLYPTLLTMGEAWLAAATAHQALWSPTKIAKKVGHMSPGFGLGSSPASTPKGDPSAPVQAIMTAPNPMITVNADAVTAEGVAKAVADELDKRFCVPGGLLKLTEGLRKGGLTHAAAGLVPSAPHSLEDAAPGVVPTPADREAEAATRAVAQRDALVTAGHVDPVTPEQPAFLGVDHDHDVPVDATQPDPGSVELAAVPLILTPDDQPLLETPPVEPVDPAAESNDKALALSLAADHLLATVEEFVKLVK